MGFLIWRVEKWMYNGDACSTAAGETLEGALLGGNSCRHRFFQYNIVIDDRARYISLSV